MAPGGNRTPVIHTATRYLTIILSLLCIIIINIIIIIIIIIIIKNLNILLFVLSNSNFFLCLSFRAS